MSLHVSYGTTESGDDLPVLAWHGCPTDERVIEAYKRMLPAEFEEEAPGRVNFRVEQAEYA
jgi:hypothetical protein